MTSVDERLAEREASPDEVSLGELTRTFLRIGFLSFGGPAAQIPLMHRIVVDQKRWIGEERFLHALNYCMLLPGPEAQQLATYIGWLLHGIRGGLVTGILFVLPGALILLALSMLYVSFRDFGVVQALFFGVKAAVLAVVLEAVVKIGRRVFKNDAMVVIAAAAFVAIFVFDVPFPVIVALAALVGFLGARLRPDVFLVIKGAGGNGGEGAADRAAIDRPPPRLWDQLAVVAVCLALWALPVVLAGLALGFDHVFVDVGVFFSQLAVVTFGGAYAVLAYMAQQAVDTYQWLAPGEMLDGLGLAETTPGPLIMIVEFVAFLAGHRQAEIGSAMAGGVIAALMATWVTFVPCFLWIFAGAPYIERLRHQTGLNAALSGITAAVVGVILNLAVWFGLHVLFRAQTEWRAGPIALDVPVAASIDWWAVAIFAGAALALLRFKAPLIPVLAAAALGGLGVEQFLRS